MIRFGDAKSTAGLKKLWKECFADEDAYIDAFFEALYEDGNVLMAEENGMLMGASFFLPGKLYLENGSRAHGDKDKDKDGGFQDIRYVYALAVYPSCRRRGIAGKLLRFAYETYQVPLIAEPAEEGLVGGFYEPLGFAPAFYLNKKPVKLPQYSMRAAGLGTRHLQEFVPGMQDVSRLGDKDVRGQPMQDSAESLWQPLRACAGDDTADYRICTGGGTDGHGICFGDAIGNYHIRPADVPGYCSIRDAYFLRHGYVSWPERHIAFAIQEHRANGGGAFILTRDMESGAGWEDHKIINYDLIKQRNKKSIHDITNHAHSKLHDETQVQETKAKKLTDDSAKRKKNEITHNQSRNAYADLTKGKKEDIVLYYVEGGQIVVTETTLAEQEATDFFATLMPECSTLLLTSEAGQEALAQHAGQNPGRCLNGMAFGLPSLCGYLNLSLD